MTDDRNVLPQRDSLIFFTFVVGTVSSILSLISLRRILRRDKNAKEEGFIQICFCKACREKNQCLSKSKQSSGWKLLLASAIMWCLVAFLVLKIAQYPSELRPTIDPYDALGIAEGASKDEVRRAYRKLVLLKHPDHGGTVEQFMELSQAYEILTNADTMERWQKYGKSDGPVDREYGFALPIWLINEATSPTFVLLYYVVALLSIPLTSYYLYRKWFTGNSSSESESLQQMIPYIFSCLLRSPTSSFRKFTAYFSATPAILGYKESREPFTKRNIYELENIRRDLEQTLEDSKLPPCNEPVCIEFRVLLQAHLERICVGSLELKQYQSKVVNQAKILSNMVLYGFPEYAQHIYERRKGKSDLHALKNSFVALLHSLPSIIQACTLYDSPLIQLPYITKGAINTFMKKKKGIKSIEDFVRLNEKSRKILLDGLCDEEIEDFYTALKAFPTVRFYGRIRVAEQEDAESATTNSFICVDFLIKRKSLAQFLDEAEEGHSKKATKRVENQKFQDDAPFPPVSKIKPCEEFFDRENMISYDAHCPYFSERASEKWWVYTLNGVSDELMQPIFCFDTISDEMCFSWNLGRLPAGVHKMTCVLSSAVYLIEKNFVSLRIEVKAEPAVELSYDVSDVSSDGFVDLDVVSSTD